MPDTVAIAAPVQTSAARQPVTCAPRVASRSVRSRASVMARHRPGASSGQRYEIGRPSGTVRQMSLGARPLPSPSGALRVRVLGPLEVTVDGAPLVVDTRKALAILALLAVEERPF